MLCTLFFFIWKQTTITATQTATATATATKIFNPSFELFPH